MTQTLFHEMPLATGKPERKPKATKKPPTMQAGHPDNFQTPAYALNPLLPYLRGHRTIWECSQGKGNLTKGLAEAGFDVIGTDLLSGQDFLEWVPPLPYHCIVTNPPFSIKDQFLERAFALRMPFAFLVPYTTLEGAFRQSIFREHRIELVLFDRRINFETPNQKADGRAWFPTMWLTHRLKIGQQLTFARLPLEATREAK